ncbi:FAD-dependent oxidoreductase [Mycolicibacterium aichiense]|uniref:ferredoxin--NADP(+) reductase n=2 Tax=Mycolicibacterium TaxID=1866885 RepID=A0AAD1HPG2_9MYCO|nr:FAD-dependent oxidoreductase [Mycolicibacterium aichiense]MCV7019367.1 FAD-dependent oxidoreductase [Mycolicibacterium aichiense]BBX09282.1 putative ferredoxin/ferredoxin--NADP reductase [Mycolicibacterium aichiense]SUA13850.1 putative ferredoxin/ferredoxin--NADP reductase [Mycolicibacterium aichiense]
MTYVVTQNCCNDATCVEVCPVNCIHPAPGEPGYASAELLHIDPRACIDCGACAEVCPVDAIVPDHDITDATRRYLDVNAAFFQRAGSPEPAVAGRVKPTATAHPERLRVAVVGSGPSAFYAAENLLSRRDVDAEVTMIERLPFAGGLVRYGVAPDHAKTKSIERTFQRTLRRPGLTAYFDVEVGADLSSDELSAHHHAVLFASGTSEDRRLGIPGADLAGSHSAREFVAWYNGHPDFADRTFDLSHPQVVIVGNGNVALDVARILTTDVDRLRHTDIAEHALDALSASAVRNVMVLGRRGPEAAACTTPELIGLAADPGVDITVDDAVSAGDETPLKVQILAEYGRRARRPGSRTIDFRFQTTPVELVGDTHLTGVRVQRRGIAGSAIVDCGLLLQSIGYRGAPIPGLPFDTTTGTVANQAGRVFDSVSGHPVRGRYVAGWIKRGPTGVIGTNRFCADETVHCLVSDFHNGLLRQPTADPDAFARLIQSRSPHSFGADGWIAIDRHERAQGRRLGRPRVKFIDTESARMTVAAEEGGPR